MKWLSVFEVPVSHDDIVNGPTISTEHDRLDQSLALKIVAYLSQGRLAVHTTARCEDVLDPNRGEVVGLSLYTDGVFAWDEGLTYYVREYQLSPGADFIEHCRSRDFLIGDVDDSHILAIIRETLGPR